MKLLILISFILVTNFSNAQYGLLGKKTSIGFNVVGAPSFQHTYNYNPENNIITKKKRFAYANYQINLSRIVSKNGEVSLGYTYTKIKAYTIQSSFGYREEFPILNNYNSTQILDKPYRFLSDPQFNYHQVSFAYKHYRLGSVAPTGKYIGFGINFGYTEFDELNFYTGIKGLAESSNYYKSTYKPITVRKFNSTETKIVNLQFSAKIGKTYPISKNILFSAGLHLPLLTIYSLNYFRDVRLISEYFKPYERNYSNHSDINSERFDISTLYEQSVRKYTFITANFGVQIYIGNQ